MCCFYSTIALFQKAEIKKCTFSRKKIGKDCLLTLVNWLIVSMLKMAEYAENSCWIHLFTVQSVFCTEATWFCYGSVQKIAIGGLCHCPHQWNSGNLVPLFGHCRINVFPGQGPTNRPPTLISAMTKVDIVDALLPLFLSRV